jgi:hypothetical protein
VKGATRTAIVRIADLAKALRDGPRKSADLAAQFNVCIKTVMRDLTWLRAEMGHDLTYDDRSFTWRYRTPPKTYLL